MNYLWGGMLLTGVLFGLCTGNIGAVSAGILASAKEAVTLAIGMLGAVAMWSGIMEVAAQAGLIQAMTRRIKPLMRFMFPHIPEDHPAVQDITTNCIANFLGLGWAATPAGLRAMEGLSELNKENCKKYGGSPSVASNEMCTFLILNISSLQLIPVNMIAYRAQYGSVNPTVIVGPGIVATAMSTGVAVVFCKVMDRRRRRA